MVRAYQRNSGAGANFCFGGPIFPENVGERGGGDFFPGVSIRKFFAGQIPVTTWVKPFFSVNKCKIVV